MVSYRGYVLKEELKCRQQMRPTHAHTQMREMGGQREREGPPPCGYSCDPGVAPRLYIQQTNMAWGQ